MRLLIQLSSDPISPLPDSMNSTSGAVITFSGIVRDREGNQTITSLFYEAYRPMAETLIRKIALEIAASHPCTSVEVLHRLGHVQVGETSLWIRVMAPHRAEACALLTQFLDRLKQDVPIWKTQPSQ